MQSVPCVKYLLLDHVDALQIDAVGSGEGGGGFLV